jgi:defect in organelle trafficking protein DotD
MPVDQRLILLLVLGYSKCLRNRPMDGQKMRTRLLLLLCPLLCINLLACRHVYREPPPSHVEMPDLNKADLADAAIAATDSLEQLAALDAERKVVRVEPQTQEQIDYHMHQLASVDWSGPAEPLIRRLAQAVDYHVRVIGKAPPHVIIVNISKRNVTVGELLRDVALQIHRDADVVVFPQSKLIEIHYH